MYVLCVCVCVCVCLCLYLFEYVLVHVFANGLQSVLFYLSKLLTSKVLLVYNSYNLQQVTLEYRCTNSIKKTYCCYYNVILLK